MEWTACSTVSVRTGVPVTRAAADAPASKAGRAPPVSWVRNTHTHTHTYTYTHSLSHALSGIFTLHFSFRLTLTFTVCHFYILSPLSFSLLHSERSHSLSFFPLFSLQSPFLLSFAFLFWTYN